MSSSWEDLPQDGGIDLSSLGSADISSAFLGLDSQNTEKSSESPEEKFSSTNVQRISTGRVFAMIFVGIAMSLILFLIVGALYTRFIRFPSEQKRVWEESILYSVENFCNDVNNMEISIEDSYIMKELPYANGNKDREAFIKYVLKSVSYSTDVVNKKNVYGNDFVDRNTLEVVTENSWLSEGEEATINYIGYRDIEFDGNIIADLVSKCGITPEDIRYQDKLTDMFCQYIYGIDLEELPKTSVRHVPSVKKSESGYEVTIEEDIYLDKLLFSNNDLYSCFERFASSVAKVLDMPIEESESYKEWEKSSEANKNSVLMPLMYGKYSISHIWCGAYYLLEEYSEDGNHNEMIPQLGDGSKEQPASLDTPVITYIIQTNGNGEEVKLPIRVTMKEFGVSQDAIDWFEKKDIQNRGFNISSEVQYCYYVFEVTNLSKETLTVYDNTALCDENANSSGRTGVVYGLQDSVTLVPGESGTIESWNRSTELNQKYVIWGNDFARREEPVWFRVLAGDLEDPTIEKGVSLNTTRE